MSLEASDSVSESVSGSGGLGWLWVVCVGWLALPTEGARASVSDHPVKRLVVGSSGLKRPSRMASRTSF